MCILLHCIAMSEMPNPMDSVLRSLVAPRYHLQFPVPVDESSSTPPSANINWTADLTGKFRRTNPCHHLCLPNCQYQTQVPKLENHPSYIPWQSVQRGRSLPRTTQSGHQYSGVFLSLTCVGRQRSCPDVPTQVLYLSCPCSPSVF